MTYTTPQTLEELRELQRNTTVLLQAHELALDQRRMRSQGKEPTSLAHMPTAQRRAEVGRPSESTMAAYRRRANRLLADAAEHGVDVWQLAQDRAGTKPSWYAARAALLNIVIADMRSAKRRIDEIVRLASGKALSRSDQSALIECGRTLARLANVLTKLPDGIPMRGLGIPTKRRVASKSKSLRGLPNEWREELIDALPSGARMACLAMCLTGCRPVELEKGVQVERLQNGDLYTSVAGAKRKHKAGQTTRETILTAEAGAAAMFAGLLRPGQRVTVKLDRSVDAFRKLISRYGRKLTPLRGAKTCVSSYSFRHQYKSDLQAAGLSRTEVAQAMGHQTTETAKYYGGSGGKGSSAVKPVKVRASEPVRNQQSHLAVSARKAPAPAAAPAKGPAALAPAASSTKTRRPRP